MSNYELALRRDGLFAGLHTTQLSEPIRSERHFTKRPHGKRRSPAFHEVVSVRRDFDLSIACRRGDPLRVAGPG